jgi:hypothetical protein
VVASGREPELLELDCCVAEVKEASFVSITAYLHIAPSAGVVFAVVQEEPLTG